MKDIVIRVENLSKRYLIGQREPYKTLRDTLAERFTAPFRALASSQLHTTSPNGNIVWALRDVSFEVKHGEVIGVIGRNGAGKSTLLKILSRITEPTAGRAMLHGRVGSLLEVGTGFNPELTGRENIFLNGAILGMRRREIERKFDEIVAFAELEKFIDTPVKRYSSGMYMRLAFSVAAHLEPEILIVDEVLAVGDVQFQKKCMGKMGDVVQQGRTILFVSHNMSAIRTLCENTIWLEEGQVRAQGSSNEIVQHYLEASLSHSQSSDGFVSIQAREDRIGEGILRLKYIRFLDSNLRCTSRLKTGQAASIAIGYSAAEGVRLDNVLVGFTLSSARQEFTGYCQNDISGNGFQGLPPNGEFRCTFPKLPLTPGTYTLNVSCKVGTLLADRLPQAAEFEVVDGDFYDSKLLPPSGYGDVLIDYKWAFDDLHTKDSALPLRNYLEAEGQNQAGNTVDN